MKIKELSKIVTKSVIKYSPQILVAAGVVGIFGTAALAVKATPTALNDIKEKQCRTNLEIIKTCWRLYIPALALGTLSSLCVISACRIHTKRNAALLALYSITEKSLSAYQKNVTEAIGEKKNKELYDESARQVVEATFNDANIINTGKGHVLCLDMPSGRYFYSNAESIYYSEGIINKLLITEMEVLLNDFYSELGLPLIPLGEYVGWRIDRLQLSIVYSSQLTVNKQPCLTLDYKIIPLQTSY